MILSLPPELRAMIWNHIFVFPSKVQLRLSPNAGMEKSVLRVLTVCKTLYKEAVHLFYRHNQLLLGSTAQLYHFLVTLPRARRLEITNLTVTNFGLHYRDLQCATKAFSMLLLCPNLTHFQLDLTTGASWRIMEARPVYCDEMAFYEYQSALDCLGNLRGLKSGSIRGIHPGKLVPKDGFDQGDLVEAACSRAEYLRRCWRRPRH